MGFKQVFDNLTVKMDALKETDSPSRRLCFEPLFLDFCNVTEILILIARNNLLQRSYLVCSSTRCMTLDKLLLPQSSSFLHYR